MAIAYYIPDQAKLLAGSQRSEARSSNSSNSSSESTRNAVGPSNPANNRGYGTTINITVPTCSAPREPSGCWDFLTQVFCQALSFYHESSQLQPTVIKISVNLNLTNATEISTIDISSTQQGPATTPTASSTLSHTRTPTEDIAIAGRDGHTHDANFPKEN